MLSDERIEARFRAIAARRPFSDIADRPLSLREKLARWWRREWKNLWRKS